MKKSLMIIAIVGVVVLSLGMPSQVFAKNPDPAFPNEDSRGLRRGGSNGTGIPLEMNINLDGALEDYVHTYLADAIGIEPSDLTDENFNAIALELGYDLTEIREFVKQAHNDALAQALADGVISQETFDWLSTRGFVTIADGNATGMAVGLGAGTGTCLSDGTPLSDGTSQTRGYRGGNK